MHDRLADVLGEEVAGLVMEHLPPSGWADVATKRDLDQLAVATKRDLDQLAAANKADLELATSALRLEMKTMAVAFHRDMTRQTWILAGTLLAGLGALGGLLH